MKLSWLTELNLIDDRFLLAVNAIVLGHDNLLVRRVAPETIRRVPICRTAFKNSLDSNRCRALVEQR